MKAWRDIAISMCGVGVLLLGMTTLIGRHLGLVAWYEWSDRIGMAHNTAYGFVLTGCALILAGWKERPKE